MEGVITMRVTIERYANSNYIALDNVIERTDQCDFHIKFGIVIFGSKSN